MPDAAVLPPPEPAGHTSALPIPPLDDAFFQHQFADNGQSDNLDADDFDFDFSFDDLWIPSADDLEDLLDSTGQELNFLPPTTGAGSDNLQPTVDKSFAFLESDSSDLLQFSGNGDLSAGDRCPDPNGCSGLNSSSPASESQENFVYPNAPSSESNGSNRNLPENGCAAAKEMNCLSPESDVSAGSNNCGTRSVTFSPNLNKSSIRAGIVDQNVKLDDGPPKNSSNGSLLKRKKGSEDSPNNESRLSKFKKSNYKSENNKDDDDVEEDEKRKVRLLRNRESAQLSRQRKKQYIEELQEKVKMMNSTIQDLNAKISYFMTENATLRQQLGGPGAVMPPPPPPPGMYPYPGMAYPWMPFAPPYMMKPQGSQVPLVPIPKLKPQGQKTSKKAESKSKKNVETRTKKVLSINVIGLFVFLLLLGGLAPMINTRYGGARESFTGVQSYGGSGFYDKHHDKILMVNGTTSGDRTGHSSGKMRDDEFVPKGNGSEPLLASLYVPRNDKLVKIDGNLVIHSVLASEKAMAANVKKGCEPSTDLAVPGDLARIGMRQPHLRALGSSAEDESSRKTKGTDGRLQKWFREGLTGPMLSSGMCTEVLQFTVDSSSGSIVPSASKANISSEHNHNSTHIKHRNRRRNRRILQGLPLPDSSLNATLQQIEQNSQKQKLTGSNSSSPMIVSILVDPRETADTEVDGVMGTKSISKIFVVVLIDSVKYVTYSCMLPFKGAAQHLVAA